MRWRIVRVGHFVPKLPLQFREKDRHRTVHCDRMAFDVRAVMRHSAKRKGELVQVSRFIEQGLNEIGATDVMHQVAEETAAERVVA